jgi:hypothetical protein
MTELLFFLPNLLELSQNHIIFIVICVLIAGVTSSIWPLVLGFLYLYFIIKDEKENKQIQESHDNEKRIAENKSKELKHKVSMNTKEAFNQSKIIPSREQQIYGHRNLPADWEYQAKEDSELIGANHKGTGMLKYVLRNY